MAEKKKVVAKRKVDRKAFVASRGSEKDKESRKRFYVKTRVAELEKSGKTVSPAQRKALREKFDSGNVSRKGFAAPKKRTRVSSSAGRTDSTGRSGMGATAQRDTSRNRIEGRGAYAPKTMPTRNQIEGRGAYAPPKTMPSRNQIEGRYGSSASVRKSGANAAAASRASTPRGRTDSAGRSGFGSTKPRLPTRNEIEGRGGSSVSKGRSATSNMKGIAGYGRTDSAGRSGFGATKPKAPRGRPLEDKTRRNRFPNRTDLRNMNPGKKYQAVKPIGKPGKKYLMSLAKKNLR